MRILLALFFVAASPANTALAQDPETRIAIIDSSTNTKAHLAALADAGVKVIGRYYARCAQRGFNATNRDKRMLANQGEIDDILSFKDRDGNPAFAILSIYQFYSDSFRKFSGTRAIRCKGTDGKPKELVVTLPAPGQEECATPVWGPDRACPADPGKGRSAAQEAELDANAAVEQAKKAGQPAGSAIYFGVDFDSSKVSETLVKEYFQRIRDILTANSYLVGAYGDGAAIGLLKRHELIDFGWLNASRGHAGSVEEYNSNNWDLFQTATDIHPIGGLEIDTNVQNPSRADSYIGFWRRDEMYSVPHERTKAIHSSRRFSCNGLAHIYADDSMTALREPKFFCGRTPAMQDCDQKVDQGKKIFSDDLSPRVCFGHVARLVGDPKTVKRNGSDARVVPIDCDEDGNRDGWMIEDHLSSSFSHRPEWIEICLASASECKERAQRKTKRQLVRDDRRKVTKADAIGCK